MIELRLKEERERLGLTQEVFADKAGAKRRTLVDWEKGVSSPTAVQLAALAAAGVDVQYVLLGQRQGQGIGESAVHQAVLDAIDLLSLEKKVDANQLAKAVTKLALRSVPVSTVPCDDNAKGIVVSGSGNRVAGQNYREYHGAKGSKDDEDRGQ
ncbi:MULTISPECIES: helix-turn-helix transcriptional regulator [Chromobacterium]|uniref:HTH cro/C1-type domain-containing protein n=1 Tax=Chromobacterium sphagni TaxID=1903179 RepID=A0A1S1WTS5_9NEIS|nr:MULTISPECIES: helix-turn-helix transcriptional regulator [Chromobacterium]OHX10282.1 hypothetical protein BI347_21030 [Chromobacterium sphagni]OHX19675.1 hypothetical protein BI344_17095 [Chromobacterium sphagni]